MALTADFTGERLDSFLDTEGGPKSIMGPSCCETVVVGRRVLNVINWIDGALAARIRWPGEGHRFSMLTRYGRC